MNNSANLCERIPQLFLGLLLEGLWGCTGNSPQAETSFSTDQRHPKTIYILTDDLGYGDLGSYGQKNIKTPNPDRLAEEGMRFTQHYSGSTVCAPSRSALMIGLHTGHTPIRGNKEIMPVGQYPLQYGTVTIPKLLKEAGYATGDFGKWGLGYPGPEGEPSLQGFDECFGFMCQRRSHFFYPEFLYHDPCGLPIKNVEMEGNRVQNASTENFQWQGKIKPGSVNDYISYFPDMMLTFSELANQSIPPGIDGISMVPILLDQDGQKNHKYLYWEFHSQGGNQAIQKGIWKAVRLNVIENSESLVGMHDLSKDISGLTNVSEQYSEIVEEMDSLFREAHVPSELYPLFNE